MFSRINELLKFWQFSRNTGLSDDDNISFVENSADTNSNTLQREISSQLYTFDTSSVLGSLGAQCCSTIMYSNHIAKTMCCYMSLAYESDSFMREYLLTYNGVVLLHHHNASIISFPSHNLAIVTFSGTKVESLKDWWVNITGTYNKEWKSIKPDVVQELIKHCPVEYNIVLCGHSKGGIEAILAFTELQNDEDMVKAGLGKRVNSCYVAGVPDYFVSWEKPAVGIFNIKDARDPVANILGAQTANWEVRIGDKGSYSINYHRIISYFNHFNDN